MKTLIVLLILGCTYFSTFSSLAMPYPAKDKVSQMQMATVNLNTATLDQLVTLPGVGKKKAAAIIEYRSKNGKFKKVEDLTKVKGVGVKMLSKIKSRLKVS